MSIEEDIKQGKFENEFQKATVNILFTGSWLYNTNATHLKAFGITPEQFTYFGFLEEAILKH